MRLILLALLLVAPNLILSVVPLAPALAQQGGEQRATGTVQVPVPPPQPRGAVVTTPEGRQVELPPGAAADVRGANVVVERPTERGSVITLQNDVLFDFDKSDLRPDATQALQRVADLIRQRQPRTVRVVGHTDSIGTESYNQALSLRRAEAVRSWLAEQSGMPPMQVEGRGESQPVAPNTTPDGRDNPEGRQQNRRVEIYLDR